MSAYLALAAESLALAAGYRRAAMRESDRDTRRYYLRAARIAADDARGRRIASQPQSSRG
jgi:hypothetical protein